MVLTWMMIAVSPWVRDLLSVVIVRVTLHEVSPRAIAIDVAIANARYLIALTRRCFCVSVSGFMFLWFCALGAGYVTLWGYVRFRRWCCLRRGMCLASRKHQWLLLAFDFITHEVPDILIISLVLGLVAEGNLVLSDVVRVCHAVKSSLTDLLE